MSRNKIILLAAFFAIVYSAVAQDHIVEGKAPNLYLSHKIAPKETWYSIARIYNLAPKDLAVYNKAAITKPLEIGQQVEIPLTVNNFSQDDIKNGREGFMPVYHVVQPREWLYRISVNYNKVPVERLQKWNSIGKDGAKAGTKLIIGYLKVKDGTTMLAQKTPETELKTSEPVQTKAVEAEHENVAAANSPVTETAPISIHKEGSYFKSQYDDSGKSSSGVTGVFKSTSGWKDGKYYALANNVPIGTIIKIIYPSTNKTVYAKVLGELPDMKESAGLALRISDAAAYELGSPESKFSVDIKY